MSKYKIWCSCPQYAQRKTVCCPDGNKSNYPSVISVGYIWVESISSLDYPNRDVLNRPFNTFQVDNGKCLSFWLLLFLHIA